VDLLILAVLLQPLCRLLAWLGWLQFVRHVHDTSGADAVRHVLPAASAFRSILPLALRMRR
jgi:hypothetical protein